MFPKLGDSITGTHSQRQTEDPHTQKRKQKVGHHVVYNKPYRWLHSKPHRPPGPLTKYEETALTTTSAELHFGQCPVQSGVIPDVWKKGKAGVTARHPFSISQRNGLPQ